LEKFTFCPHLPGEQTDSLVYTVYGENPKAVMVVLSEIMRGATVGRQGS